MKIKLFSAPLKVLAFAFPTLFITVSCHTELTQDKTGEFPVVSPIITDTTVQKEYVAEIVASRKIEIRSRIKGFLEATPVDEGQSVKAGELLFAVSPAEYKNRQKKAAAAASSAKAEQKQAQIEYDNNLNLFEKSVISKSELEMSKAKLDLAKANVDAAVSDQDQADLDLSYTEIRAPYDGEINRIPNKKGSLVDDGTLLTTLTNSDRVYAWFNLSETEYLALQASGGDEKSKEAELIMADNSVFPMKGVVETSESEIDKTTGNVAFRATFPNPQHILKHGATGKLVLKTQLKQALLIPQKSTFEIQGNVYVFVLKQDNSVEMRKITPFCTLPESYVVGSGLTGQDRIIYEGAQKLKEGEKIIPKGVSVQPPVNR